MGRRDDADEVRPAHDRGEAVVRAAARLFVEKGYEATSMQDIADELGMLKGSLYYYIDSKADLLWEVSRRNVEAGELYKNNEREPLARLRQFTRDMLLFHLEDPVAAYAVVRNFRALAPDRREQVVKAGEKFFRRLRKAVIDGQRAGSVCPDVDPTFSARVFFASMAVWLPLYNGSRVKPEKYADAFADFALASVACDPGTHERGHRKRRGQLGPADEAALNGMVGRMAESLQQTEEPDDRKDELVQTAARLFVEKGYEATSMQDIADELGILKGSLYHYIGAKRDLLTELAKRLVAAADSGATLKLDPLPRLRAFVRTSILYELDHELEIVAITQNYRSLEGDWAGAVDKVREGAVRRLRKIIADGQRAGVVCPDVDATFAARTIMAMLAGWFQWTGNVTVKGRSLAEAYADLVVAAVTCDEGEHQPGHRGRLGALSD